MSNNAKYYKTKDVLFVKLLGDKVIFASDTGCNFQKRMISGDTFKSDEDFEKCTEAEFENIYRVIHSEQIEFMSGAIDITED